MKPHVADYHYRTTCLRIEPTFGPVIRLTQFPRDLKMSNGEVYVSSSGYQFTGYTSASSLSPALIDLEGIAGIAGITRAQLSSGQYDNARCYCFATTWHTPIEDEEPIVASILGKTTLVDDRYRIEEMALLDALNQSVGETYGPTCPKVFGGQEFAGCKVDLGPLRVTGSITDVSGPYVFRDSSRSEVADWFAAGDIVFTTGPNAGLPPQKIKAYESDGTIELFEPFYYAVSVGDEYEMTPGCRKRKQDCHGKYNNIANFGGFPDVPLQSTYQKWGT